MTPQEENARVLLNHYRIKPQFFPHDGSTISELERMVDKVMEPDDQAICKNCSYPYEEHALIGRFCPNVWDEDSDWSLTWRFAQ